MAKETRRSFGGAEPLWRSSGPVRGRPPPAPGPQSPSLRLSRLHPNETEGSAGVRGEHVEDDVIRAYGHAPGQDHKIGGPGAPVQPLGEILGPVTQGRSGQDLGAVPRQCAASTTEFDS